MKKKKVDLRKIKITTQIAVPLAITDFYDKLALSAALTMDSVVFGQFQKWRKKRVTKYLHLPIPTIERHYEDSEDGDGEFEGLLLSVLWINTHIPIGTEIIEVPVYRKMKGQTIKFKRYGKLKTK